MAAPAATTTTMAVTSGGSTVTTVAAGNVVTLTATVKAGATAVTIGQVNFCDASAAYCTDIHLLGTRQLTSAGTAVLKFIPGVRSHSYKAVFAGTPNGTSVDAGSTSSTVALTVTATVKYPTTTTIAKSGNGAGNYSLTATVTGPGGAASQTGSVSFLDTSNGNSVLGTAELGTSFTYLSFLNSSSPATGAEPQSVVVGDFNGDGIPDLAVANYASGTVTILLGNGNGTFTQAANSPVTVGEYPISITVGDFNGDGIPDLAVANNGNGTVTILLGNGNGTFTQEANSPVTVGYYPISIAVGDFNGDGISDLAVTNGYSVTVFLGNGNGTFTQAATVYTLGLDLTSVVVGDFNGDGIPDLAVADSGTGKVAILLGNGNGTFTQAATSQGASGSTPTSVAVGDFNGDGILDLAVTNGDASTVTILLGNGNGTFTFAQTLYNLATGEGSIAVGDFNGDGIPDLAVTNIPATGSGTVTIMLGVGNNGIYVYGTFTKTMGTTGTTETGYYPISIAVGDFNGDGISDLATANELSDTVTVVLS